MIVANHHGQHSEDCYACKLKSLVLDRGRPKTHVKGGDPWKDNPVVERIEELKREGAKSEAQHQKQLKMAVIEKGSHADV